MEQADRAFELTLRVEQRKGGESRAHRLPVLRHPLDLDVLHRFARARAREVALASGARSGAQSIVSSRPTASSRV